MMMTLLGRSLLLGIVLMGVAAVHANEDPIYDESRVPEYTLPDSLMTVGGEAVETPEQWWQSRRAEISQLFETQMYGRAPQKPAGMHWSVFEQSDDALEGIAERKQVTIFFGPGQDAPRMDLLIYLPKDAPRPVPVFLGLNFNGNHAVIDDPNVRLSESWMRPADDGTVEGNRATESSRGSKASRWPIGEVLRRGYGVATIYYGDIDPDFDDGFRNGVHAAYYTKEDQKPAPDEWGSIATWAWGLSRALDYMEQDAAIDHRRVAVVGHSRLGKTALWAGASDQRFALTVSNDSGCGGAALSRRKFGETVKRINTSFPHWFCDNFVAYNDREHELPFDQHQLIALVAPRPVLVSSASEDRWADPRGEFLSARHAAPVYRLLGVVALEQDQMPGIGELVGDRVGYHLRAGQHDMTIDDWNAYMNFADRFLK
jgi:hypothetical protein